MEAGRPIVVGHKAFFVATNPVTGPELWRTDGTKAGTGLVADLRQGPLGSYPDSLTAIGEFLLFAADDGVSGRETWMTDGTASGTRLLIDLQPAAGSSNPSDFLIAGGRLYFVADTEETGRELWTAAHPAVIRLRNALAGIKP